MNEERVMKRKLLLLLMAVLLCTGCQQKVEEPDAGQEIVEEQPENQGYRFTDALGREVTVENPKRVAALLGSYADIWYLAGGEVIASADDAWDDFDLPLPEDAVNLGMTKELSLEKLFEANPDFVLASSNTKGNVEWLETLEAAGITVAYFEVNDFSDYLNFLKICTDITGRSDLYKKNGLAIAEQIEEVIACSEALIAQKGEEPTILSLRASSTFIRAKNSKDNVLGEMLASLGCVNIADYEESLLENLSIEQIILQDPDYIFFIQQGDNEEGTKENINSFIAENPAWSELTAVKEGRVYLLEKELYALKPNDRWAEALENLERILTDE
jgi:iron complex transport system substrate-binding protein